MKLTKMGTKYFLPMLIISLILSQSIAMAANKVDLKKTTVSIDISGLTKIVKREIEKACPFDPEEPIIYYSGQPEAIRLLFDGQKSQYGDNDFMKPHMLVFPLKEFQAIYAKDARKSKSFKDDLATLKRIVAKKSAHGVQDIPVLPSSDGAQFFHNQERFLKFKQGSGVSFVTAYGNGDGPLTNDSLFYTFQGTTNDDRFWVAFFWPLKTTGMPKAEDQKPGVAYVGKLARNKFKPDLDLLDKTIESLDIH